MLQLVKPLAVIDLETTGINLSTDRIVEIAIVKILPDGKKQVKRKLINPEMPISQVSKDMHGITDEMVKEDFDYSIPNEGVCSAEFPGGCILCEE